MIKFMRDMLKSQDYDRGLSALLFLCLSMLISSQRAPSRNVDVLMICFDLHDEIITESCSNQIYALKQCNVTLEVLRKTTPQQLTPDLESYGTTVSNPIIFLIAHGEINDEKNYITYSDEFAKSGMILQSAFIKQLQETFVDPSIFIGTCHAYNPSLSGNIGYACQSDQQSEGWMPSLGSDNTIETELTKLICNDNNYTANNVDSDKNGNISSSELQAHICNIAPPSKGKEWYHMDSTDIQKDLFENQTVYSPPLKTGYSYSFNCKCADETFMSSEDTSPPVAIEESRYQEQKKCSTFNRFTMRRLLAQNLEDEYFSGLDDLKSYVKDHYKERIHRFDTFVDQLLVSKVQEAKFYVDSKEGDLTRRRFYKCRSDQTNVFELRSFQRFNCFGHYTCSNPQFEPGFNFPYADEGQ